MLILNILIAIKNNTLNNHTCEREEVHVRADENRFPSTPHGHDDEPRI